MSKVKEQQLDRNDEASNLPDEAFALPTGILDIDDRWLQSASMDDQLTAIRVWFNERFLNGMDAMAAGQHPRVVYGINGVIDPREVLKARFEGRVSVLALQQAIWEFHEAGGVAWARRPDPNLRFQFDLYDEDFAITVDKRTLPLANLKDRIAETKELATLTGSPKAQDLAKRSAFSAAITALESFLWETMVYWVEHRSRVVKSIITKHPYFQNQEIKLGTIFDRYESLKGDILGHMQNIVWHNPKAVGPLFKYGLGQTLGLDQFADAIKKRHDIVHRSGYTKAGFPVSVTDKEIDDLCVQIITFATHVAEQINDPDEKDPAAPTPF